MGARRVEELRQRFATQGYVEFRINPLKVVAYVLGYGSIFAILIAVGVAFGPIGIAILGLLVLVLLAFAGWSLGIQLLGAGPPLRIDREGVTFRHWNGPVVLPWSDGVWLYPVTSNGHLPQVAIELLQSPTWKEHLATSSSHHLLDRWSRYTSRRDVRLPKVFDASTKDIVALVDADFLDGIGVEAEGPRTLRDVRDGSHQQPSPEVRAMLDAVLELQERRKAAEKQAKREHRELTAEEVAAFDAEMVEIALRDEDA